MGGKGVFIKAIEEALVNKEIDIAVHSLKDVTSALHESIIVCIFRPRVLSRLFGIYIR